MNHTQFIFVPETTSTNILLAEIAMNKTLERSRLENFTVLYTDYQTEGRGLAENEWHSRPKENILASFYFTPPITPRDQFYFNIFFSLSVKEMLDAYSSRVTIKWPNDIYIGDKKIAGILIEHTLQGYRIIQSIAGVGINLNQTEFHPSVKNCTSLKLETGGEYDSLSLLREVVDKGYTYYRWLEEGRYDRLRQEYYRHLYRFEQFYPYRINGYEKEARITGINEYGHLQLEDRDGTAYSCGYKEVRYV